MKSCPETVATHEPRPHVKDPLRTRPYYLENSDSPESRRTFQEFRAWTLWRLKQRGLCYVELNGMKFYAHSIAAVMPRARFVFIHRHPAEFVRSGMRRGWYDHHPADGNRLTPRPDDPAASKWSEWQSLEKICWLWDATNRYFLAFLATIPRERQLSFAFDDLMNFETGHYRDLFTLVDVKPPSVDEAREVLTVRHNSQDSAEFPEYDRWSNGQRHTLHAIAGDTMRELGYE